MAGNKSWRERAAPAFAEQREKLTAALARPEVKQQRTRAADALRHATDTTAPDLKTLRSVRAQLRRMDMEPMLSAAILAPVEQAIRTLESLPSAVATLAEAGNDGE